MSAVAVSTPGTEAADRLAPAEAVFHVRALTKVYGSGEAAVHALSHELTENEVLYPAAIVIGDLLRHEGRQ